MTNKPGVSDEGSGVQTVERAMRLLFALAGGPRTLTEVSGEANLSKSTALRLLNTMVHGGLVTREPLSNKYLLGPACLTLGRAFLSGGGGFIALAPTAFVDFHNRFPETVTVHVRVGGERVCVDEIASPNPMRFVATVGSSTPVFLGSAGRVLLAYMETADVDTLLDPFTMTIPSTGQMIDPGSYREELAEVRHQGYALSEGERVAGASAISVPIFDQNGEVVAALSVLGPSERMPMERRLKALPEMHELSSKVTVALTAIARAKRLNSRGQERSATERSGVPEGLQSPKDAALLEGRQAVAGRAASL